MRHGLPSCGNEPIDSPRLHLQSGPQDGKRDLTRCPDKALRGRHFDRSGRNCDVFGTSIAWEGAVNRFSDMDRGGQADHDTAVRLPRDL